MGRKLIAAVLAVSGLALGAVRVSGHVASDTNAPVANAAVTLRSATGERFHAFTDPTGVFTLSLPPGEYTVDVERSGFFALDGRKVALTGAEAELKLILNPLREFSDSIDVPAAAPSVALDQTASVQQLAGRELIDLPYPTTHNLRNAMRILPGVVQDNNGGVHVNGGAENQVQYLLDGFNVADPLTGNFDARMGVESVQSMEVLSGRFPAEFGKGSAGVVAVNAKMGDDKIRYSSTNFVPGVDNSRGWHVGSWNPRFNLSGPIRKGRAWASDSLTVQYDQNVIRDLPRGQDSTSSWRYSNLLHGQANLSASNILYVGFLANQWAAQRTGLTALDPIQTTVDRHSHQWFADVKDQIFFGHGAFMEFGFASNRTFMHQIPQGSDLYILTPGGRRGNFFVNGTQDASRDQTLANVFLPAFQWLGNHQLKSGFDVNWLDYSQNLQRTGFEWYDQQSLVRRVVYAGNGHLAKGNTEMASYLQDSWRPRSNLLLELGLRADRDQILGNWTASPRLGAAWSPSGLENTKISAGYAIAYDATNLQMFTRPLDQYPVTTYFLPGLVEHTVRSWYMIPGRHISSPSFHTWSLGVDQRVYANLYLKAQAMRRRGRNQLTYSPMSGVEALVQDSIYALDNRRTDSYDSVEFTVRQNLHKQYEWMASYTRSRASSNAVIDVATDQPAIVQNNIGRLGWDTPNRLMSWGYLPTFWDNWAIAYLAEYRSGFPFSVQDDSGRIVGPVNARRYPDFFELNLHAERKFRFRGQQWAGRAGFNNITNHQNPNAVINDLNSDQFLRFFGGQSRALNFRIRWLGKL